ncbi:MAG: hypothetical protein K8R35_05250, partial [Bacteroidales bacterium]|nr:hypothetical protein [Bacteroidales bacterium]
MIRYLKNSEIDRKRWDDCIEADSVSLPYGTSWYLDIMAPGWDALIDGDYNFIFPLPNRKKYGLRYIFTPVFLQKLGLFSYDFKSPR